MSKCPTCGCETLEADGCLRVPVQIKHQRRKGKKPNPIMKTLDPIPMGNETRFAFEYDAPIIKPPERCPDCNAQKGAYHHRGCDWEECPNCHHQLLMCDGECG